jgi:hypothetical protein
MKKRTKILSLLLATAAINLVIYAPDRRTDTTYTTTKIRADLISGASREMFVTYPSYASLFISSGTHTYYLDTWEYCMFKGLVRCNRTVVPGVVYFEEI